MSQKTSWTLIGVLSILGGLMALYNPAVASLTAEMLTGWIFLLAGILQAFVAFRAEGGANRIWVLLGGLLAVAIGVMLLGNPLKGLVALTLIVATLFLVSGLVKLIAAWPLRQTNLFWFLLVSGAVSVLLALMILANFPASAASVLGILLAVELLSNGVALITLAQRRA